jgi:hypothetical protein
LRDLTGKVGKTYFLVCKRHQKISKLVSEELENV